MVGRSNIVLRACGKSYTDMVYGPRETRLGINDWDDDAIGWATGTPWAGTKKIKNREETVHLSF